MILDSPRLWSSWLIDHEAPGALVKDHPGGELVTTAGCFLQLKDERPNGPLDPPRAEREERVWIDRNFGVPGSSTTKLRWLQATNQYRGIDDYSGLLHHLTLLVYPSSALGASPRMKRQVDCWIHPELSIRSGCVSTATLVFLGHRPRNSAGFSHRPF